MRVIYFERNTISTFHIHASSSIRGVYIPDENIILYKEQHGTFGGNTSSFSNRQEILDEVRPLLEGITPNVERVTYSGIKEFEYDGAKLKELIQNAKLERELRDKVRTGIDALLEEAK